ncbi:hypothetical protein V490_05974 [Pseudogymnoascus sp. VKM F-3557]|nr:hypothetical protein V490_05974 [Pseudogymnoascus sp. VKM F-3557]
MSHFAAVFLAVACLAVYFIVAKVTSSIEGRRYAKEHGCQPPNRFPQSERILGLSLAKSLQALTKSKQFLFTSLQWHREFGNTYSSVLLGQTAIVTIEPENLKAILATQFHDFGIGKRNTAVGPLLGQGIFSSEGSLWEHSRALVRPSFARASVADLATSERHIQHLMAKIPRDGSTVDLQPLFYQITLDTSTEFLFGESVDVLRSPAGSGQQLFGQALDYAQTELNFRLRLGPLIFLYRNKEFDRACTRVQNFVDKYVAKALEFRRTNFTKNTPKEDKRPEKYIFMNELALATDDPIQIRSELLNLLLAGRDTTAGLLSNTFYVLARRPDIRAKLKREVDQLEGRIPDYTALHQMKYVKNVLNESLRLYPSVPQNMRYANRNTTLPVGGGPDGKSPVFVAKGQLIVYGVFSLHRRKDLYGEDADEYRPERWDGLRVSYEYLPFSAGPRVCIGKQFALTEAAYTLVRLVQEFEGIENRDSTPWLERFHLTLSSNSGVQVALHPRM